MNDRQLILGSPGTGKTERLLSEMERCLQGGISPSRVAFVSFTRAAVREARDRVVAKFGVSTDEMGNMRTLHSLCFRELGLHRRDVFGRDDLRDLETLTGEELTGHIDLTAPTLGERGDALLFVDQFARNTRTSIEAVYHDRAATIDRARLDRFLGAYRTMREDAAKLDFTDMLEIYVDAASRRSSVDVDVAFIDEGQDLTPLQWRVVERAFGTVPKLFVAGDDDQTIHAWAGADVNGLLGFAGTREVLARSYRLPRAIFRLARAVVERIRRRFAKLWQPTDREGTVEWLTRPDEVDLSSGTWLLLARTRRQLGALAELARSQGVVYSVLGEPSVDPEHVRLIRGHEAARRANAALPIWHDALTQIPLDDREYLLSARRRGESLTAVPRVRIETIHGAKGAEAENVMLLTDLNERVRRGAEIDPDAENRVLYVALTRAREALFLVTPRGRYGYQI